MEGSMTSKGLRILLMAGAALAVGACNKAGTDSYKTTATETNTSTASTTSSASNDPVASAESAAPASLAHNATIMVADAGGVMKTVRQGSNGWSCIPDDPNTPGTDPMCFDANAG